jgi:hypothetical protein
MHPHLGVMYIIQSGNNFAQGLVYVILWRWEIGSIWELLTS